MLSTIEVKQEDWVSICSSVNAYLENIFYPNLFFQEWKAQPAWHISGVLTLFWCSGGHGKL